MGDVWAQASLQGRRQQRQAQGTSGSKRDPQPAPHTRTLQTAAPLHMPTASSSFLPAASNLHSHSPAFHPPPPEGMNSQWGQEAQHCPRGRRQRPTPSMVTGPPSLKPLLLPQLHAP